MSLVYKKEKKKHSSINTIECCLPNLLVVYRYTRGLRVNWLILRMHVVCWVKGVECCSASKFVKYMLVCTRRCLRRMKLFCPSLCSRSASCTLQPREKQDCIGFLILFFFLPCFIWCSLNCLLLLFNISRGRMFEVPMAKSDSRNITAWIAWKWKAN